MSSDKSYASRTVNVDGRNVFVTITVDMGKLLAKTAYKAVRNKDRKTVLAYGAITIEAPDLSKEGK